MLMQRYYSLEGTECPEAMWYARSMMPIVTLLVDPIRTTLDTCLYEVEFPGGEITEVAANIMAESMYAHCDVNGNE